MNYKEGAWHALVGLDPQYEHMKGGKAYDEYMKGYNDYKTIKSAQMNKPDQEEKQCQ